MDCQTITVGLCSCLAVFSISKVLTYCSRARRKSSSIQELSDIPQIYVSQLKSENAGKRNFVRGHIQGDGQLMESKVNGKGKLIASCMNVTHLYSNDFLIFDRKNRVPKLNQNTFVEKFIQTNNQTFSSQQFYKAFKSLQDISSSFLIKNSRVKRQSLSFFGWVQRIFYLFLGLILKFQGKLVPRGVYLGLQDDQIGLGVGDQVSLLAQIVFDRQSGHFRAQFIQKMIKCKSSLLQKLGNEKSEAYLKAVIAGVVAGLSSAYVINYLQEKIRKMRN